MSLFTQTLFPSLFDPANFGPNSVYYPYNTDFNKVFGQALTNPAIKFDQKVTKLVIWDWDDTCGPLYPVADLTANKAFLDLAPIAKTDRNRIASVATTLPGEFICHEPRSLLHLMLTSEKATGGMEDLAGVNDNLEFRKKAVESIVREWEHTRREMFKPRAGRPFASVPATMEAIRNAGGYNMIVTSSMPQSFMRRSFEAFGEKASEGFMKRNVLGVFCRNAMPGIKESTLSFQIPGRHQSLNAAEARYREFLGSQVQDGVTEFGDHLNYFTGVAEDRIKGAANGHDILGRAMAFARIVTGEEITCENTIKVGDTGSDYKAAVAADVPLFLTTEGTVTNPILIAMHKQLGCQKKELDPVYLLEDVQRGDIVPSVVVAEASKILNHLKLPHPACG